MHPSSANLPAASKRYTRGIPRPLLIAAAGLLLLQGCASNPPAAAPGEAAHAEAKAAYLANDYQRTLAIVEPLAIGGEAWAQYTLGYMYYYGRGVAMDRQMAKLWIQRAAQQDYGPAKQALQRLSVSEPKRNQDQEMEAPSGKPVTPPGRAPMPAPPASSSQSPATPAPTPALPPGEAPMPMPPPETANPAPPAQPQDTPPTTSPPASPGAAGTPPQDNASPMGQAPAPAGPAPEATPPASANPPPAVQTPMTDPAPAPAAEPMPAAVETAPARDQRSGSGIKGAGWIGTQDPQHYTLQLLGASNEAAVVGFIRDHHLEREAAYFAQTRDAKPWYTVIYGSFTDRQSARQALGRLPAAVHRASPWIRSFKDIQTRLGP